MALYRGPGGASDATNDATSQSILAATSAAQAAASAAAASASASQAATSATNSASSATSSANSATAAASSANSASTSATNAANSATAAQTAQTAAELAETNAETAEANAETAEANATASAALAQDWATKTSGPVAGGEYSSKYNAQLAATSATNAANSATSASTSASAASTSATNATSSATAAASSASAASTSATNAANSATAAAGSATSAASSASTATTQATNAASSATAAATSASNASTSETNAASSASAASTSATNAANSATSASTSATNAANSATAAAASYDSFDDRYLGSKTSNPTLDNDGNALLTGALYWNSTVGEMRVYNGSAWVAAYVPAATYVAKAGDVMTGSLEVPTQASLKATALTRASIRPSLLLDFANTKQLDPRITFSRPTTATYFDSNGVLQTAAAGVPRFDHDPVTGESKGLLIEEQRTNLLTYSSEFDNAAWTKTRSSITANAVVAPDGTLTGDKIVENTSVGTSHYVNRVFAYTVGTVYTLSAYFKASERTQVALSFNWIPSGVDVALFDLVSGTVVSTGSYTATISPVGNGWYRCTATKTADATSIRADTLIAVNGSPSYTGDGFSGIYIWGAQLEAGSFPTSYIPTVASQVTRSADSASITGSNFSSWYRADEGTLYADFLCNSSASDRALTFKDSTDNGRVWLSSGDGAVYLNSTFQAQFSSAAGTNPAKRAITFSFNNAAGVLNGGSVGTDTSVLIPTAIDRAVIGNNAAGGGYLNGTIKRIAYYPKRLTNTELQGLTS